MLTSLSTLSLSILTSIAFVLGLIIGSFLNVVIYRLPKKIQLEWTQQAQEWLEPLEPPFNIEPSTKPNTEFSTPLGITLPASHCIKCKQPIKVWHNIPFISFVLLRGKCAYCHHKISLRYPFVEILTALLSAYVVYHFGWSIQALSALILTWALITLTFIDYDHHLLPDAVVFPTLWLGLALSLFSVFVTSQQAIIGCLVGYLSLWSVFHIFKLITGKEGMGHGDFKMLALLGAWLGWQMLPQIILFSSLFGSIIGITLMLSGKLNRDNPISFGPFLAITGWVAMLWGAEINSLYLKAFAL